MAKRLQKRKKLKEIKLKQKLNREKNKEVLKEKLEDFNFNNITKFSGIKAYALINLEEIINLLKEGNNDDNEILLMARKLMDFSIEPRKKYNEFLRENKITKENKNVLNLLNRDPKYILNTTERALLKFEMQGIILEFATKNTKYEAIDYGAIRVCFETVYFAILQGLEERKIQSLNIYVGYGDVLADIKVEYKEDNSKYNLNEQIIIFPIWNSLDDLYNEYTKYKTKYINFNENSLYSLATAYATEKQYNDRENGKELISYNGIALNYLGVLEVELKKLISQKTGKNIRKIRLVDAINELQKLNLDILSQKEIIEELHNIREIRNKVAHGFSISYKELDYIQKNLLDREIFKYISWELNNTKLEKKNEYL
ncbi:hypothetical protein [Clostridium sp.]|uniref:hypothetical protein n=1 Tax=Clostridium sp. TaxID=1506 RepID=UPI0026DA9A6B|nr:hypothetical protein [Clostridium sp.]MDO5040438.1 hypothetical protein [Clostridium sp.]